MESRKENKLSMGLTVQTTCNRYSAVTAQIPTFVTAMGDLGVKIQYIQGQVQIQAGKTDGITLNKQNLKIALCDKAFEIASAVSSYAATVKNPTLAGKVNFTKSDLLRSRDTETAGLCQNIRTEATANLAALAAYAVTAADLTDLAQKISTYATAVSAPTDAKVSKKTAGENIDHAFVDFDAILNNRMDTLMPKFQALSPDFVKDYTSARNIIDSGGGGGSTPPTPPPAPPAPPA